MLTAAYRASTLAEMDADLASLRGELLAAGLIDGPAIAAEEPTAPVVADSAAPAG